MASTPCDKHFLSYAVTVAARGQGTTAPNPSVGAVIVKQNAQGTPVIVGEATTAPGGRPHAEPQAIAMAGSAAQGATLYVSLEPCNHHGQTPPCTEAIKAAGIARVVCALTDPDSRVAGQGLAVLQNAGISVDQVHVEPLAPLVVAGHILRIRNNRPFVRLKVAVSSDGLVAEGQGAPVWVTGEGARNRGHMLRAFADAILVGRGTLEADNPSLDCRLPGLESRSPRPILLDSNLRVDLTSKRMVEGDRGAIILCNKTVAEKPVGTCQLMRIDCDASGRLDPEAICNALSEIGLTSVLIEGGPSVAGSFLEAGLVDEVFVFRGANPLHERGLKPFGNGDLDSVTQAPCWHWTSSIAVGDDAMTVYRHEDLLTHLHG